MGIVTIEIDGQSYEAETGSMIIEVADDAGVHIPRFCYHKKLSVAANCRMCLVDVTNLPKAVPACATPVADGMKILTQSEKALMAQKSVMEFLLINHPLDCPICDQGGECELQDVAMGYGNDVSRFSEGKRVVNDKDIGPLIETDMTRCIHCTRCVRFGTEIVGLREMGATGRGEHMEIGTFVESSLVSELAGNIIDLCPVGALTAKPSLFKARAWELQATPSISPHDCLGTNLDIHHRRGQVIRVVPKENESINEVWITDRDRFSYQSLNESKRLLHPMIKQDGQWQQVSWEKALTETVEQLKKIIGTHGAEGIGALASPSSTLEEFYLLQSLFRGLGSHNIDHRLRQIDFSTQHDDPMFPKIDFSLADLDDMDATLLVAANLRNEQPLLSIRLRKSTRYGRVMAIAPFEYQEHFRIDPYIHVPSNALISNLQGVAAALVTQQKGSVSAHLTELFLNVTPTPEQETIANELRINEHACIVIGQTALEHSLSGHIRWLGRTISRLSGCKYGELTPGANSAGGYIAGALPHRTCVGVESKISGWTTQQMLQKGLPGFLLLNTEPELDSSYRESARQALKDSECVVVLSAFAEGEMMEYANILLPTATFTETSGTFISIEGNWQTFRAAVSAKGEARPAWKILRVLGNLFGLPSFDYNSSEDVKLKVLKKYEASTDAHVGHLHNPEQLEQGGELPKALSLYDSDSLVRRARCLQQTPQGLSNWRRDQIINLTNSVAATQIPVKEVSDA